MAILAHPWRTIIYVYPI